MDDVSDCFKSGFLSLHKNTLGKNYQQKSLKDRMNNFNTIRRETRNTLIYLKRQIDENMSPINTPEPTKVVKKVIEKQEAKKPNKRLEMLNKWKADKEKRKQEEQKKAKPLFKVCHIPVEVGLPNLENVNKEIKGKRIKSVPTPIKSQFAPPNHKFRAPKNIKPINISDRSNNSLAKIKSETQKSGSSSEINKINSRQNPITQRNTRSATNRKEQISKLNDNVGSTSSKASQKKIEDNKNNPKQQKSVPVDLVKSKIKNLRSKNMPNISIHKKLQYKDSPIIQKHANRDVNCSSPKKHRRDEKPTNQKSLLVDLTTVALEVNSLPKNKQAVDRKADTNITEKIKGTPKKNKIKLNASNSKNVILSEEKKSLRMVKQPKLKEDKSVSLVQNSSKPADLGPKKNVGWNVIEIVDSDDEVFSEAINNKTPKRITRQYKKTPMKRQNPETISDNKLEKTLLMNKMHEEKNCKDRKITPQKTPRKNTNFKNEREAEQAIMNAKAKSSSSTAGSASPDYPLECVSPANGILSNSSHTPVKNSLRGASPVYISPFVTISRGKSSARKEYQVRHSTGDNFGASPEFNKDISNNISPKTGADYFTKKLNNEIARIERMCDEWSKYRDENNCPDEAKDMIDVAIGQSKLLISKKFQQFRDLINQCESFQFKDKPVTCEDLHGFWDMVYMQVEDLNKRFNSLDNLKTNNWREVLPEKKTVIKRGRGRPKKATASSSLKSLIKAARNMKKSDGNTLIPLQPDETVFSGGYYIIKSPIRDQKLPTPRSSSTRKSMRVSLSANQDKTRVSSSGLTMMKISQAIKCGDGLTPSKSILKTDLTKSANRITKSVFFKDDLENKVERRVQSLQSTLFKNVEDRENDSNEINLISFSPVTPTRRSRRLTKIS